MADRIFNGKVYTTGHKGSYYAAKKKSDAQKAAKRVRGSGRLARVVKEHGMWQVYSRGK
jgi:hypothetical protein